MIRLPVRNLISSEGDCKHVRCPSDGRYHAASGCGMGERCKAFHGYVIGAVVCHFKDEHWGA